MDIIEREQADEQELSKCLEDSISKIFGRRSAITDLQRTPSDHSTSFASEILDIMLDTGDQLKIFLKDFGSSRLPKDELGQRRNRELHVYRDLLDHRILGTAVYFGDIWDEREHRYWLLLEFVDGVILRYREFDDWVRAAGWLGLMQEYFAQHTHQLNAFGFFVRHDASFFWSKAELALRSVPQISTDLAKRLGNILKNYDRLVDIMAGQPATLVHGSFRPENILVESTFESVRICPIDWELAAFGSPLYDFAFLSDGFPPNELDILWDAYRQQVTSSRITIPEKDESKYLIDCFRLHKIVKSLSESVSWKFPESTVAKLIGMAEMISENILL